MSFIRFSNVKIVAAATLFLCAFGGAQSLADEAYTVVIDRNVAVKMRDGVTLYAPTCTGRAADDKFPVLLTRTPYDKTGNLGTCMRVAAAGYVCVAQDCAREICVGRRMVSLKHESEDGYDTIEWLAHQP